MTTLSYANKTERKRITQGLSVCNVCFCCHSNFLMPPPERSTNSGAGSRTSPSGRNERQRTVGAASGGSAGTPHWPQSAPPARAFRRANAGRQARPLTRLTKGRPTHQALTCFEQNNEFARTRRQVGGRQTHRRTNETQQNEIRNAEVRNSDENNGNDEKYRKQERRHDLTQY